MIKFEIDPIQFQQDLQGTFRRYLYTSNIVCDSEQELQDEFWSELAKPLRILHGPFVHCTPSYMAAESLAQLIDGRGGSRLSKKFLDLPVEHFDPHRLLHLHQVQAIRKARQGRNVIVATGTGSGKTECFLLPILQSIFEDPTPGLRAIIVYPMNALANDQLDRLRKLLVNSPDVSFGRYTGDTPHQVSVDDKRRAGALENERFSRAEIRAKPPHILLTNFAMLEYLLLRPQDSELFRDHRLGFVILDEAHSYAGAQGVEIALLMRRLKEYLLLKESDLQFLLTSATIGGASSSPEILKFAADLTGQQFAEEDLLRGETVTTFDSALADFPTHDQLRNIIKSNEDFEKWTASFQDAALLHKLLTDAGLEPGPLSERQPSRLLYDVFSKSELLERLHFLCQRQASSFSQICNTLDLPDEELVHRGLSWLFAIGSTARRDSESAPLLPTRLHFFCRGLSGATICLNDQCDAKGQKVRNWSAFYLEDRKKCQHCETYVLPLRTCVHCGMPACKIQVQSDGNKWLSGDDLSGRTRPVVLSWMEDSDEEEANDDDEESQQLKAWLCLSCQHFIESDTPPRCCDQQRLRQLRIIAADPEGDVAKCPRCGGGSGDFPSVFRDFVSGEDAPTAVLTETLMRHLPENPSLVNRHRLPAQGRNLLVFSDSRQRAAFFAPYLNHTMAETAYLGPIETALRYAESREERPVTIAEVASVYVKDLRPQITPIAVIRERDEAGLEHFRLRPTDDLPVAAKTAAKKEAIVSLCRHVCSSTKQRGTLTGLGIAAVTFDISDSRLDQIAGAVPALFERGRTFGKQLVESLLNVIVQKGALDFPEPVTTRDVFRFGLYTPEAYTYTLDRGGRHQKRTITRWNPYRAPDRSRKNAINKSRQAGILARALGMDRVVNADVLSDLLDKLWGELTPSLLREGEHWPGEFRLDEERILLTTHAELFACNLCGRLTTAGELGICPSADCVGKPETMDNRDLERRFGRNHYRARYRLSALPLEVKEHTAQLNNETGKVYQERFIRGEVNVLSSSTTFEMGVDVGGLKAVLLRNMPPKSSNYVQRAGRAGRRKDGVSVVLTHARNAPHDQYLYQSPAMIIEGRLPVPMVNVTNKVLAQRHVNSLLLGYFLRELPSAEFEKGLLDQATIETFFLTDFNGTTLVERFSSWIREPGVRKGLVERVKRILPKGIALLPDEALTESEKSLCGDTGSVLSKGVNAHLARFEQQKQELQEQAANPQASLNARRALTLSVFSLERLVEQFRKDRLINFLSSQSWLPGYAFPQNTVKLLVRHGDLGSSMRLERDREVGISEYAPGSEIVADGHLLRSGAVWFDSREPDVRFYTRCPQCRKIRTYLETEKPEMSCDRCGTQILHRAMRYLRPDAFSTLVSDEVVEPGMYRKRPPRNSDVFLLEGSDQFRAHEKIKGVYFGIKPNGKMFRANSGHEFKGFKICRRCGRWFENAAPGPRHTSPWGGECSGRLIELHLAHELVTDILQLRFHECVPPAPKLDNKSFWLSFQAAFINGCSDALGIDPSDLGATFNGWTDESWMGELVIYDRVPGGAGHIDRILDKLDEILTKSLERVEACKGCTDIDSSCYACLRSYSNQSQWELLCRAPVVNWLSAVLRG